MIHAALREELEEIATLMAASHLLQRYRVTKSSALESLDLAIEEGDVVLVHGDTSRINGIAWLTFAPRMLDGAAYLRLLLVAEGLRDAGVGTRLLAEVESQSRGRANHMYLLATTDNTGARRFYERHGYRFVGELPGLVWPDLDEALYHKPLRRMNDASN